MRRNGIFLIELLLYLALISIITSFSFIKTQNILLAPEQYHILNLMSYLRHESLSQDTQTLLSAENNSFIDIEIGNEKSRLTFPHIINISINNKHKLGFTDHLKSRYSGTLTLSSKLTSKTKRISLSIDLSPLYHK